MKRKKSSCITTPHHHHHTRARSRVVPLLMKKTLHRRGKLDFLGQASSLAGLFFSISTYFLFVSKVLPRQEEGSISARIQDDEYYGVLIILFPLSLVVLVYANWMFMKFFRHNF